MEWVSKCPERHTYKENISEQALLYPRQKEQSAQHRKAAKKYGSVIK
jgi:hypothetical protein